MFDGLDVDCMKIKSRQYTSLYIRLTTKFIVVESMQSIFNYSMWSWHDNLISGADISSPCQVQSLLSFQAPCPCFVLNFCKLKEKCLLLQICFKKSIIKQLLNLVFTWYKKLEKPYVAVLSASAFGLVDYSDLSIDNSWYHAQPHPIITCCIHFWCWQLSPLPGQQPSISGISFLNTF